MSPDLELRQEVEQRARDRALQHRIRIPATPVDLVRDYSTPDLGIRQVFRWAPHENEWRLLLVDPTSQRAGFLLRRPVPVPRRKTDMVLYLELDPPEIGDSLAVGLLDQEKTESKKPTVVPLASYQLFLRVPESQGVFAVPLTAFETASYTRNESDQWTSSPETINWRNIIGAQLTILSPSELNTRQIRIKNLQIAPRVAILQIVDDD